MKIRLFVALGCGLALGAGALPGHAAPTPACATFSDPKGDTALTPEDGVSVPLSDPALDITGVKYASTAKALVITTTLVAPKADRPTFAPGSRVQAQFNVSGKDVVVYYKYTATRDAEANAYHQKGIRIDDVFFPSDVEGVLKGNDMTITVKYKELKRVGADVVGKKLTDLKSHALGSYVGISETYDSAAGKGSYTPGSACK